MKNNNFFRTACGLLSFTILLSGINFDTSKLESSSINNDSLVAHAKISDPDISELYENSVNNQPGVFQTNYYSSYYFNNLKTNFANNSHGTCAYVAASMLLSYYDTFWSDRIILEKYDAVSSFTKENSDNVDKGLPSLDTLSPGIKFEPSSEVNQLTNNQYLEFVEDNKDEYFQSYLIDLAIKKFGDLIFDTSDSFGLTCSNLAGLLSTYFTLNHLMYTVEYFNENTIPSVQDRKQAVIDLVTSGIPVVIFADKGEDGSSHAMIAYDYGYEEDDLQYDLYVHTGWGSDTDGTALSHANFTDLGYKQITGFIYLEIENITHFHSNNYVANDGTTFCSCNYVVPRELVIENNYLDFAPTYRWISLIDSNWYTFVDVDVYFEIQFILISNLHAVLTKTVNYMSKSLTLSMDEWIELNDYFEDDSSYKIDIAIDFRNTGLNSNGYVLGDLYNYYCSRTFSLPTTHLLLPRISPNEYGFPDAYASVETSKNHAIDDFTFTTRRYRTGYIHNEYVVLSPRRVNFNNAYIIYEFDTPIIKLEVSLAHWRSYSYEQLDANNGEAKLQYYDGSNWITKLDLLAESTNLTRDRTNPDKFLIEFNEPINMIKFYAKVNDTPTNDDNRGRICIGDLIFYSIDDYMPLSGSELPYEPDEWNSDDLIRDNSNCYAYAINYQSTTTFGGITDGPFAGGTTISNLTYDKAYQILWFDSRLYSFSVRKIEKYEKCPEGYYKIALYVNTTKQDAHFYRQNSDGTWSHKFGSAPVTNLDYADNVIYDPDDCIRHSYDYEESIDKVPWNRRPYLMYDILIGYYAISIVGRD